MNRKDLQIGHNDCPNAGLEKLRAYMKENLGFICATNCSLDDIREVLANNRRWQASMSIWCCLQGRLVFHVFTLEKLWTSYRPIFTKIPKYISNTFLSLKNYSPPGRQNASSVRLM